MTSLFYTFLYEPLFNALMWLYQTLGDLGIAIIVLTLVIKLILFWPSLSSIKSQKLLQETQPKLEALKKKYEHDKEEMGRQLMKFYKDNKVNPLSSCLPLLIQLPILIALYRVFFGGFDTDASTGILIADQLNHLYGPLRDTFTNKVIDTTFFNWFDLAATRNYVLAISAGAFQFLSSKLTMRRNVAPPKTPGAKDENIAVAINKQMIYFLPVITIIFGIQFPAGVTLYWLISTLFTLAQQYYIFKRYHSEDNSQREVLKVESTQK